MAFLHNRNLQFCNMSVRMATRAPARMTAEARREQLLDVTKAIVAERGFHAVSIEAVAREAGITRPIVYGHVGDGNLHYNLSRPPSLEPEDFLVHAVELSRIVHDTTAALDGSISAEHGLGSGKAAAAAAYKSDVEVDLMRAVKAALDPAGLMNPGKVLPLQ